MKKLSFKAEEIDNRLYNVEILEKLTAALQLSIDQAAKDAATAQNAAKTAEATAKTAEATAKTAKSTANTASHTANTASATANVAKEAAATAQALAEEGKILAEEGKALANTAKSTADTAVSTANTAQSTAETAISTANTAQATANTASKTAETTQAVAEEGKLLATEGKALAETAKSTADTAGMTAESAKLTADTAKATADTAKSTAETAQSAAAMAQSAAEAAQAAADAAQGAANTAQATANLAATAADLTALQAEVTNLTAEVATKTSETAIATAATAAFAAEAGMSVAKVGEETAKVAGITSDVTTLQSNMAQVMADIGDENAGMMKDMADIAEQMSDLAEEVKDIIDGSGLDGTGLQDNLNEIRQLAENAQAHSEAVQELATEGKGIAEEAKGKAETAQGVADTAEGHAQQGISDAAAAQKSADDAQASATEAATAASAAQARADEAWAHAESAKQSAESAQTSATNATIAAGTAQSKADEAFGHAQDALTASEAAATNANNAAISAAGAEAKANEASIAAGNASKAAGEAEELATKAEAKAVEAEGHASAAAAEAVIAQQEATAAAGSAANAASSASAAAENATKAQGFADNAAQLAEQANTKAQEANTHAESALGQAAIAQEEAGKAQKEAEDAQAFATEAEEAAKEARAAADLAQLTADNKSSSFKGEADPVIAYNNAVLAYIADKTSTNLISIPAYPRVGDLWYKPVNEIDESGEKKPDKVFQLNTAYLDIAEEVKDENENITNILYLIYKDETFTELGGIWIDVMVNTITTGFVNALGITAQKIEIKDSDSNVVFKADASDDATNKVIIGGFGVKSNAIYSGLVDSMLTQLADGDKGVYLGTDGLRIGNKFKVDPDGTVYSSEFKLSQEEIDKLALKVDHIEYAKNDSGTVPPENGWSTSLPEANAGEYIWTKYVYQDTDDDDTNNQYSYQVYRQPENGKDGADGEDGAPGQDGADGLTPYIKDEYWWLGDTNTGVMAEGKDGAPGTNGTNGSNGLTPYISGGYWWIGDTNTKIKAEGVDGTNGTSAGNLYKLENTGNAPSKPTSISASEWTKAPQEPTAEYNYCWVSAYTIDASGTFIAETPILHASYEGMISLLSDDGLKIVAKDSSTGKYHLKADQLSGVVSTNVKIGGFTIGPDSITSGNVSSLDDTSGSGIYIGPDGINVGAGATTINSSGELFVKSGKLGKGTVFNNVSFYSDITSNFSVSSQQVVVGSCSNFDNWSNNSYTFSSVTIEELDRYLFNEGSALASAEYTAYARAKNNTGTYKYFYGTAYVAVNADSTIANIMFKYSWDFTDNGATETRWASCGFTYSRSTFGTFTTKEANSSGLDIYEGGIGKPGKGLIGTEGLSSYNAAGEWITTSWANIPGNRGYLVVDNSSTYWTLDSSACKVYDSNGTSKTFNVADSSALGIELGKKVTLKYNCTIPTISINSSYDYPKANSLITNYPATNFGKDNIFGLFNNSLTTSISGTSITVIGIVKGNFGIDGGSFPLSALMVPVRGAYSDGIGGVYYSEGSSISTTSTKYTASIAAYDNSAYLLVFGLNNLEAAGVVSDISLSSSNSSANITLVSNNPSEYGITNLSTLKQIYGTPKLFKVNFPDGSSSGSASTTISGSYKFNNKTYSINSATINISGLVTPPKYTLTINPTPSDATVTLSSEGCTQSGNSITTSPGAYISWSVTKTGYAAQHGNYSLNQNKDETLNISLSVYTSPESGSGSTGD